MAPISLTSVDTKIRIKGQFIDQAREIFHRHGVSPRGETIRADGNISFEIGSIDSSKFLTLLDAIPQEYFALRAFINPDDTATN